VVVAAAAAVAAVLVAVQTFLRLSEKAESHRSTSALYGALRRQIDGALVKSPSQSELSLIRERLDRAAAGAPSIPSGISKRVEKKIG
jgi:hypothetical protein